MDAGVMSVRYILDKSLTQLTEEDNSQPTREDPCKYLKESGCCSTSNADGICGKRAFGFDSEQIVAMLRTGRQIHVLQKKKRKEEATLKMWGPQHRLELNTVLYATPKSFKSLA